MQAEEHDEVRAEDTEPSGGYRRTAIASALPHSLLRMYAASCAPYGVRILPRCARAATMPPGAPVLPEPSAHCAL